MELSAKYSTGLRIEDFNYDLPDGRIAKYPLPERDASKLLVWNNGHISTSAFRDASRFIPEKSLLVFNNTRVIRARLIFRKSTGARVEIFCLEPFSPSDYQLSFQSQSSCEWNCIVGNAKKWKDGPLERLLDISGQKVLLKATITKKEETFYTIRFEWDRPFSFGEIIENAGIIPIPPYLNRESESLDDIRYQTVFAKIKGSVAAPTAGLHFTEEVFKSLKEKSVETTELTLHVGAGTFKPVQSETIGGHEMHSEMVVVSRETVETLLKGGRKIIAVGTTSVRSLESLYWLGQKLKNNPDDTSFFVGQWEPYENQAEIEATEALKAIIKYFENSGRKALQFITRIIIAPGYNFKIIDGMFTNFHQPQSTLLLLISAFLGDDWKKVYDYALGNGFRFLSYGDSNLYLK